MACSPSSRPVSTPQDSPGESTCRITLPAREAPLESGAASRDVPPAAQRDEATTPSLVLVHAEASLSRITRELEAQIPRRLANVRGASAGIAGRANYTVDRGPLTVTVEQGALVVRTDVKADAEICARGQCYASCQPRAIARARIPLGLRPDYRFPGSRVTAEFTQGCKIRALGGFLTVDVTPTLKAQLEPELRRVQRDIDRQLPDLRREIEQGFVELASPRHVPLLGCVLPNPKGIVQGPVEATGGSLRMRFAVSAEPTLRSECDETHVAPSLPRLEQDPTLGDDAELRLALVQPLTTVASALEEAGSADVNGARVSVERARVVSMGGALQAELSLTGDVCGDVTILATPAFMEEGQTLALTTVELPLGETERIRASSLEPTRLAEALTEGAVLRLPIDVSRLGEALPRLVAMLPMDDAIAADVAVADVRPLAARAQGEDLVATVGVQGHVLLRER
jgi:hypothetical protein